MVLSQNLGTKRTATLVILVIVRLLEAIISHYSLIQLLGCVWPRCFFCISNHPPRFAGDAPLILAGDFNFRPAAGVSLPWDFWVLKSYSRFPTTNKTNQKNAPLKGPFGLGEDGVKPWFFSILGISFGAAEIPRKLLPESPGGLRPSLFGGVSNGGEGILEPKSAGGSQKKNREGRTVQ